MKTTAALDWVRPVRLWALLSMALLATGSGVEAARHDMQPRVPPDKLESLRSLQNPLPNTPEIVEKGKALYHGKGTCVNCHGVNGGGDGPGAKGLTPPPRNFQHHGFWRHRSDGELYYIIQNGSPGTAMAPFGGILTDEEIWSLIRYEQTFSRHHGPRRRMGRL
ncbi:MAG: hypothetical protein NBKEAIPA_03211 [Nitrospirae bacterium]|nr:MAG: putative cytochrome c [Nitrospira sp. OLB3]MBV6471279.1 hypothetical protein [Nitrospirota bacterium]MCE7966346.1 cytochrome c [Nitrospira sp. NTP2]MCK6492003.1 c-type cytochrome [Nitrospira sp.]MEB2338864.1 cytochrome c [Nitrospirales bacterium]